MLFHDQGSVIVMTATPLPARRSLADQYRRRKSMGYQTATELVAALQSRRASSIELVEHAVECIEADDKRLNTVVPRRDSVSPSRAPVPAKKVTRSCKC